jgi:hypothetical protein
MRRCLKTSIRGGVELQGREHTLGTRELALLLARGDGAVDMALEGGVGHVTNLVVGLDVLLDSLTAVGMVSMCAQMRRDESMLWL